MKKLISLLLALTLLFAFTACTAPLEGTYTIGICQFAQHPAQSEVLRGFKDALTAQLGDKVIFDEQHASGDASTCSLIINSFISENVSLILADTTQTLQIAASSTATVPILGAAITDYASALDIASFDSATGINVSGTSDLAPLDRQADMIVELFPEAKNVALLYCSSEVNSLYQVNAVQQHLSKEGVSSKEFAFTDSNDLASVTEIACQYADVIYIPTDNTVAECTGIIDEICLSHRVPVIAGEKGICSGCGIATLSIDYYALGTKTGEMAYKILAEGGDITQMPIEHDENVVKMYNESLCEYYNITPPADYVPIG